MSFPQDGPTSGTITSVGGTTFILPAVGTYQVSFQVSVAESAQLELTLGGNPLAFSVVGRATGTTQLVGDSLVTTTSADEALQVLNPLGDSALTISEDAGGGSQVDASLVIEQLG